MLETSTDHRDIQAHRLVPADPAVVRLAQLTDLHILAQAGESLRGMNTRDSFEAVCRALQRDNDDLDLLLATGDLSQDESAASYRYLARRFEALQRPLYWLPGNHDNPALMHQLLRGDWVSAAKQVLVGNWLILLLDSTIAGETGGRLADAQLEWLDACLRAQPERHALVCLHHHPLPCGSEWMDQLALQQPQRFIDSVKAHANVRAVLWGHVHQQTHRRIDGIEWLSTPSTCMQFKPASRDFALDDLAPGYRRLELFADGRINTEVLRLAGRDLPA